MDFLPDSIYSRQPLRPNWQRELSSPIVSFGLIYLDPPPVIRIVDCPGRYKGRAILSAFRWFASTPLVCQHHRKISALIQTFIRTLAKFLWLRRDLLCKKPGSIQTTRLSFFLFKAPRLSTWKLKHIRCHSSPQRWGSLLYSPAHSGGDTITGGVGFCALHLNVPNHKKTHIGLASRKHPAKCHDVLLPSLIVASHMTAQSSRWSQECPCC